jgi:hypothetical protein
VEALGTSAFSPLLISRTVETIKGDGYILIELGTVACGAVTKLVEHCHGKAIGILVGLQHNQSLALDLGKSNLTAYCHYDRLLS